MAKSVMTFELFIASPNDVSDERDILAEIVEELNRNLGRQVGVRIEVIRWETHTHPDIGRDAQAVINKQVPEACDLFFGIFWHRLGTPTERAPSGAIEEFERALNGYRATGKPRTISLYFKMQSVPMSVVDPLQLAGVFSFKHRARELGCYTADFGSNEEFGKLTRQHLSAIIIDLGKYNSQLNLSSSPDNQASGLILPSEDDLGMVEYEEITHSNLDAAVRTIGIVNSSMAAMSAKLSSSTERLLASNVIGDSSGAKKEFIVISATMLETADLIDSQLPLLGQAFDRAMSGFDGLMNIAPDFRGGVAALSGSDAVISELICTVNGQLTGPIQELELALQAIPRISGDISKAKRRLAKTVASFSDVLVGLLRRLSASKELFGSLKGQCDQSRR